MKSVTFIPCTRLSCIFRLLDTFRFVHLKMADHYHPESTFPVYDKIDMADSEKEGLNPKKGSKRSLNRPGHCKRLLLALLVVSLVAILMGILLGVAKYVTHK